MPAKIYNILFLATLTCSATRCKSTPKQMTATYKVDGATCGHPVDLKKTGFVKEKWLKKARAGLPITPDTIAGQWQRAGDNLTIEVGGDTGTVAIEKPNKRIHYENGDLKWKNLKQDTPTTLSFENLYRESDKRCGHFYYAGQMYLAKNNRLYLLIFNEWHGKKAITEQVWLKANAKKPAAIPVPAKVPEAVSSPITKVTSVDQPVTGESQSIANPTESLVKISECLPKKQGFDYAMIKAMPDPGKVIDQMKVTDEIESLSRQMGALMLLADMFAAFKSSCDSQRTPYWSQHVELVWIHIRKPKNESALGSDASLKAQAIQEKFYNYYRKDEGFKKGIRSKFFSSAWLAKYDKHIKHLESVWRREQALQKKEEEANRAKIEAHNKKWESDVDTIVSANINSAQGKPRAGIVCSMLQELDNAKVYYEDTDTDARKRRKDEIFTKSVERIVKKYRRRRVKFDEQLVNIEAKDSSSLGYSENYPRKPGYYIVLFGFIGGYGDKPCPQSEIEHIYVFKYVRERQALQYDKQHLYPLSGTIKEFYFNVSPPTQFYMGGNMLTIELQ